MKNRKIKFIIEYQKLVLNYFDALALLFEEDQALNFLTDFFSLQKKKLPMKLKRLDENEKEKIQQLEILFKKKLEFITGKFKKRLLLAVKNSRFSEESYEVEISFLLAEILEESDHFMEKIRKENFSATQKKLSFLSSSLEKAESLIEQLEDPEIFTQN